MNNYNITKEISNLIHKPTVDGMPLYAKLDYSDESTQNIRRSESWHVKAASTYNSPTNIRSIFISSSGIWVKYHCPYIVNNKQSNQVYSEGTLDITKLSRGYDAALNGFAQFQSADTVHITGYGLDALKNSWTASNIEEIYFDTTLLVSEHILTTCANAKQLLNLSQSGMNRPVSGEFIDEFLVLSLGSDYKNKFQRLRVVCFISGLSVLVKNKVGQSSKSLWLSDSGVVNAIKSAGGVVSIREFEAQNTFKVRDSYYRFDSEVLRYYRDQLHGQKAPSDSNSMVEQTNAISQKITELKSQYGADLSNALIELTYKTLSTEDQQKVKPMLTQCGIHLTL